MLLQQPHGDPEIQHYEKFQQRINKKNREQDPETHTEVKHAKALFSFQTSKPVQLVAEQCHQIIFHGYLYFEDYLPLEILYNVATEIYKPGRTDIPAMIPQNGALAELMLSEGLPES